MNLELKLTSKQERFHNSEAFETLFGGAAGGGKSYGQVVDSLLFALKYKKSKQIIFRRTYGELEQSILLIALGIFPVNLYNYNSTKKCFTFINGSKIFLGYLNTERDVYRYQSAEFDVVRFDELTHFTEGMYTYMLSRVRGTNGYPKQVKSSTNPGGVGHTFVKERFIDSSEWGKLQKYTAGSRLFIPSKVTENKYLMESDPDYLLRLQNLPETERRRLLDGDWDAFDGRFFAEFNRDVHITAPIKIEAHWRIYEVFDFGLDMFAFYRIAITDSDEAFVFDEIYESGLIVSKAAERIIETRKGLKVYASLAPPDIFGDKGATGKSAAEIFFEKKVKLQKVKADRENGWMALKEWLKVENGHSRLVVFNTCVNLIRSISNIESDKHNSNDVSNVPHELTHAVDALRYFASGRPIGKKKTEIEKQYNFKNERLNKNQLGNGDKLTVV